MPMPMPSGTKRRTSRPTTRSSRPRRSHWSLPRSAASSAASPGSRSRCSSRRNGGPWIPTPRRSWRCGSATSALPGWRRSSPWNLRELEGSTGGRSGLIALDREDRPLRPLRWSRRRNLQPRRFWRACRRTCHPCATSDGQVRYGAVNHGQLDDPDELVVPRSSSMNASGSAPALVGSVG